MPLTTEKQLLLILKHSIFYSDGDKLTYLFESTLCLLFCLRNPSLPQEYKEGLLFLIQIIEKIFSHLDRSLRVSGGYNVVEDTGCCNM